jgi:hypothetical protein
MEMIANSPQARVVASTQERRHVCIYFEGASSRRVRDDRRTVDHYIPQGFYNFFGRADKPLVDGDAEAEFTQRNPARLSQHVQLGSPTPQTSPFVMWQATTRGTFYGARRLPSLYPGVQWKVSFE